MDNFRDSYFQVDWDLTTKRLKGTYWGKQYDTGRGFAVTVINGGQVVTPTTEVLRLKWEKPDNTSGYVNATIVNGKFIVENIDQMFTVHGSVRADFELSVGGEFVASITFYVSVEKAVAVDAVASSSQFTALQDAVGSVDSLQQQFSNVVANVTVDSEVIAARGTEATLGARLDSTDAQLANTEHRIDNIINSSTNLINQKKITLHYRIGADGSINDQVAYAYSHQFGVTPLNMYYTKGVIEMAFYDENGVFISRKQAGDFGGTAETGKHYIAPSGAYISRINIPINESVYKDGRVQVSKAVNESDIPPYEIFYQMLNEDITLPEMTEQDKEWIV